MTGLKSIPSELPVKETLDRLAALVSSHGLTVFIRIDHSANAEQVGLPLRSTEVLFFGNPKAGTVLMQDQQTAGLDLPMKALAWEDENGKVWLTYNEVQWISQRHGLTGKSAATVKAIEDGMTMVCNAATKK